MELTLVQYGGLEKGTTLSPPCAKVQMALAIKGLEYRVQNVVTPAQVKRFNPRGRVPVLLVDGEPYVDSSDILTWLEELQAEPTLEPHDPLEGAVCQVLEDWADEVLYFQAVSLRWLDPVAFAQLRQRLFARLPIPLRWLAPSLALRQVRKRLKAQGIGLKPMAVVAEEFTTSLRTLEVMLDPGPFLVGNSLTRADLAVAAVLDQLCLEWLTPKIAAEIQDHSAIRGWLNRVHEQVPSAAG